MSDPDTEPIHRVDAIEDGELGLRTVTPEITPADSAAWPWDADELEPTIVLGRE